MKTELLNVVITTLVMQLGSNDFKQRENATRALYQLTPNQQALVKFDDPEIRSRLNCINNKSYDKWYQVRIKQILEQPMPWIQVCNRWKYLELARKVFPCEGGIWKDYREATRLLIIDLGNHYVPIEEIESILADFREEERQWDQNKIIVNIPHDLPGM
jgi:hypothetical protein